MSTDYREHASTFSLHAFHVPSLGADRSMQNSDSLAMMVSVSYIKYCNLRVPLTK